MKVAVIADDLTGACATGGLLTQQGHVRVRLSPPWAVGDADVLIVPTDTRSATSAEAGTRTWDVATALLFMRPPVLAKRIDSMLRGHIGLEVRTLLELLPGPAVIVPAVPGLGRTTVGGTQYVKGIPLAGTEAGKDPGAGVTGSNVVELLQEQTGLPVTLLSLDVVRHGARAIRQAVTQARARLLVVDAETDDDIATIASGCRHFPLLAVDPGPFTAALVNHRFPPLSGKTTCPHVERVLVVAGSPTELTEAQVGVIESTFAIDRARLDIARTRDAAYVNSVVRFVCQQLYAGAVACVRPDPPSAAAHSPEIGRALGVIAASAVREVPEVGIIVSGGDVATAVCRVLGIHEIEIVHQIFPLCAVGQLKARGNHKTTIVTKGGLVGDEQAFVTCVRALLREGDDGEPSQPRDHQ